MHALLIQRVGVVATTAAFVFLGLVVAGVL